MLKIRLLKAGIAQLVEHNLAKVGVASSSLVSRSKNSEPGVDQFLSRVFFMGMIFALVFSFPNP